MQAAGRAARTEMMQRVREGKSAQGDRAGGGGNRRGAGSNTGGQRSAPQRSHNPVGNQAPSRSTQSQPDPMRTSVDMMAERGSRRGGGFGGGNRNGAGYAGSSGRPGGGTGGFGGAGNGSRGPGGSRGSFNR
jgi:ATP-dependent RNA helicase RhlE